MRTQSQQAARPEQRLPIIFGVLVGLLFVVATGAGPAWHALTAHAPHTHDAAHTCSGAAHRGCHHSHHHTVTVNASLPTCTQDSQPSTPAESSQVSGPQSTTPSVPASLPSSPDDGCCDICWEFFLSKTAAPDLNLCDAPLMERLPRLLPGAPPHAAPTRAVIAARSRAPPATL
ncbi:MAG: hypothetical protein KF864_07995 [Phycisphaeraceae bacterium]|nr:hypothetical protein [Phycisphaeraceae bacterium]